MFMVAGIRRREQNKHSGNDAGNTAVVSSVQIKLAITGLLTTLALVACFIYAVLTALYTNSTGVFAGFVSAMYEFATAFFNYSGPYLLLAFSQPLRRKFLKVFFGYEKEINSTKVTPISVAKSENGKTVQTTTHR